MLTKIKRFLKNKLINNRLKFPWYSKSNSYISYWIENPFKTWWKARKYFKRPKLHCRFTRENFYRVGKILDIEICDIQWKDKWNTPRHEKSPIISIKLFRRFEFSIIFYIYYIDEFGDKKNGDMEYWEYLLNWLYYYKKETLHCYSGWRSDSKLYFKVAENLIPYNIFIPTVAMSLNKKGREQLKHDLKIWKKQMKEELSLMKEELSLVKNMV